MNKVKIGKIDLDTCGVGFLLGISRGDDVEVLRSCKASKTDLQDPQVICIEVGGSGQTALNNFDHHEIGGPEISATKQVTDDWGVCHCGKFHFGLTHKTELQYGCDWRAVTDESHPTIGKLVEYIDRLDTQGLQALPPVEFPSLADVFAGMLLSERDPKEQFFKGIEILKSAMESKQDPCGTIRGFDAYAKAKAENDRQIAKAIAEAKWEVTKSGRRLGYLATNFFGSPAALYSAGAEIVVAYAPQFGTPPVPKFTVAGNGIRVDAIIPALNELEAGWGGPATGTIIGSPREGSKLSLEEVVRIVKERL